MILVKTRDFIVLCRDPQRIRVTRFLETFSKAHSELREFYTPNDTRDIMCEYIGCKFSAYYNYLRECRERGFITEQYDDVRNRRAALLKTDPPKIVDFSDYPYPPYLSLLVPGTPLEKIQAETKALQKRNRQADLNREPMFTKVDIPVPPSGFPTSAQNERLRQHHEELAYGNRPGPVYPPSTTLPPRSTTPSAIKRALSGFIKFISKG